MCHIFIGFQRCIKIHINIDSLPVRPGAPPSLYPFFLQSCLHILNKVFRSTAKQPILEVGWIRCGSSKNSKELLEHLKSTNFNNITSIKSFDFSTFYTTIPHDKLKSRLASIIRNSFMFKNGNRRYKYSSFGSRRIILCKGTLWLQTQVLWRWHHQDACVSGRQHFRGFCGKGLTERIFFFVNGFLKIFRIQRCITQCAFINMLCYCVATKKNRVSRNWRKMLYNVALILWSWNLVNNWKQIIQRLTVI